MTVCIETTRKHLSHKQWTKLLLVGWLALITSLNYEKLMPASFWLEVRKLQVDRVLSGKCSDIYLTIDRKIHQEFSAKWIVTILRKVGDHYVTFRRWSGENDYSPNNGLPEPIDFCWWVWSEDVVLPPGEYAIRTVWEITTSTGTKKFVRIRSINNIIVPADNDILE